MKESKELLRRQAIADEIKRQKELRSQKHTTKTSFKPGQKVPGCGRKKGSKNDPKRLIKRQWTKVFEEAMAALAVSVKYEEFDTLPVDKKMQLMINAAKFWMAEKSSVKTTETQIRKIEVSFSDDFGDGKVIDITPVETKLLDENEGDEVE